MRTGGELQPTSLTAATDPASTTPGSTSRISNHLPYCEDVVVWAHANLAIFSCDPSRDVYNPFTNAGDVTKEVNGKMVAYKLDATARGQGNDNSDTDVYEIRISGWPEARSLRPLGVGLSSSSDANPILAIANNTAHFTAVEVLRLGLERGRAVATYLHTLSHPLLTMPNAVVPLSPESVLVTNSLKWSATKNKLLHTLEMFGALPTGSVLRLTHAVGEGTKEERAGEIAECEVVASGFALANGMALSDDGAVLAVAASMTSSLHIYDVTPPLRPSSDPAHVIEQDRDVRAARFKFRESYPLGFLVDNVRYASPSSSDADGEHIFVAAGHPDALSYSATAKRFGAPPLSPSRVASVRVPKSPAPGTGGLGSWFNAMFTRVDKRVRTVFEDDGGVLGVSASGLAVGDGRGGRDLIVAGLYDVRGPVRCCGVEL